MCPLFCSKSRNPEKQIPPVSEPTEKPMTDAQMDRKILDEWYMEYKDDELLQGNKKILNKKKWKKELNRINLEDSKRNPNTHYNAKETKVRGSKQIVTLPNSISSYFKKSKKLPVANLFGSLINSTGHSGYYYLNI